VIQWDGRLRIQPFELNPYLPSFLGLADHGSIDAEWLAERKRCDFGIKSLPIVPYHSEAAVHRTHGGIEGAAAGVMECLATLKHRLMADNTRATNVFNFASCVGDHPVAGQQLNRLFAHIFDFHVVRVQPESGARIRLIGQEFWIDANANTVGHHFAEGINFAWSTHG
jgi:hypothetical protein